MPAEFSPARDRRRHDLDALRSFAMLLGIGLHASLAFFPAFWIVEDRTSGYAGPFDEFFLIVHGFRMPLFFLLSGFFTAMLWRRRGLLSLLGQRLHRIALPLLVSVITIVPLVDWVSDQTWGSDIWGSILSKDAGAVANFLEAGIDPSKLRDEGGLTPLHLAALVGDADIAVLLLEAGADPFAMDNKGDTPLGYAFFSGSKEIADALVEYGFTDWRSTGSDWGNLEGWGFGAEDYEGGKKIALDSWLASFHHLWFLWFLLWLVTGFAIVVFCMDRFGVRNEAEFFQESVWPRRFMWALIPLTIIPQLAMGDGGQLPSFGPDTSTGLIPIPHVLIYYAAFFAFGAVLYERRDRRGHLLVDTLGRRWKIFLPLAVVIVFPVALVMTFSGEWELGSVAQIVFTWMIIFSLMGAARAFLSKERRGVRYLSDSSYWLYLAHLPLIIAGQDWIREWNLPSGVKFVGLATGVSILLLITYQLFIRYTLIGAMLNGRRRRSRKLDVCAEQEA